MTVIKITQFQSIVFENFIVQTLIFINTINTYQKHTVLIINTISHIDNQHIYTFNHELKYVFSLRSIEERRDDIVT